MKPFKKITNPKKFKGFTYVLIIFFFMSNLVSFGSEDKSVFVKSKRNVNELEEIFFKKSIPYNEYDDTESQLKLFFGRFRDQDLADDIFYPDLSIINTSDLLREIYKSKLNDMGIN